MTSELPLPLSSPASAPALVSRVRGVPVAYAEQVDRAYTRYRQVLNGGRRSAVLLGSICFATALMPGMSIPQWLLCGTGFFLAPLLLRSLKRTLFLLACGAEGVPHELSAALQLDGSLLLAKGSTHEVAAFTDASLKCGS